MRGGLNTGGVRGSAKDPEEEKRESAPVNSRVANYAVIDRLRDLAKWLIVVLGAIGGVLLTGAQLSDLGEAEGVYFTYAVLGIILGIGGAAVALGFTVLVLLPVRISLHQLARAHPATAVHQLVEEEPEALRGHGDTIKELKAKVDEAKAAEKEAAERYKARDSKRRERKLERARRELDEVDDDANAFVTHSLTEIVRLRVIRSTAAMLVGGLMVAGGIGLFSWAANHGDDAKGEAAPKRASGVVVELTEQGRDELNNGSNPDCKKSPMRAIALGGPADALEMVAVPTEHCRAARFVLTPEVGAVVNEQRLRAVRACDWSDPRVPCVVYENTPPAAKAALRGP